MPSDLCSKYLNIQIFSNKKPPKGLKQRIKNPLDFFSWELIGLFTFRHIRDPHEETTRELRGDLRRSVRAGLIAVEHEEHAIKRAEEFRLRVG